MDAKEALEILSGGTNQYNDVLAAIAVSAKALKKQIPQKPIQIIYDHEFPFAKCPKCEKVNSKTKYCSECGQRLDWGEK